MKMSSLSYGGAAILFSQLVYALPSRAQAARSSLQCQNVPGNTAIESLVFANYSYTLLSEDTNTTLDGTVSIPHKGVVAPIASIHIDVIPSTGSFQAAFSGTLKAARLQLLFAPGARIPYGFRTTTGTVILTPITAPCLPTPRSGGGGGTTGSGGGGQCPPGQYPWGVNGACITSTASLPYSPNKLVASSSQSQFATPAQIPTVSIDIAKWEGISWQSNRADN
jgi:hypothetical protein